jgi:predicted membrane channel-forming protein YqfA (hemolysin III family)
MKSSLTNVQKRIRIAGIFIIAGLLVELITLRWSHPTAFLFFLLFGGALMAVGIIIYLLSLLSQENQVQSE